MRDKELTKQEMESFDNLPKSVRDIVNYLFLPWDCSRLFESYTILLDQHGPEVAEQRVLNLLQRQKRGI